MRPVTSRPHRPSSSLAAPASGPWSWLPLCLGRMSQMVPPPRLLGCLLWPLLAAVVPPRPRFLTPASPDLSRSWPARQRGCRVGDCLCGSWMRPVPEQGLAAQSARWGVGQLLGCLEGVATAGPHWEPVPRKRAGSGDRGAFRNTRCHEPQAGVPEISRSVLRLQTQHFLIRG